MTNISKQLLPDQDQASLENQLVAVIEKMNKRSAATFLSSVLTSTEKTMLMKRLAAILMLHHGYSSYAVEKILRISPTTASKYQKQFWAGDYKDFLFELHKQSTEVAVIKKIFKLIDNINAPLTYDRWRYLK